jgi:hypothetical protein
MSKLKTPQEKKQASLALDTRNVFSTNDKARRKGLPRAKQLQQKAVGRAAKECLHLVSAATPEDELVAIEGLTKTGEKKARNESFRKPRPDSALGDVLEYKRTGDQTALRRNRR